MWDSNISKEDIMKAAKKVGIYKFISKLPGKLQYNVKERGAMLSGGQRQLIAFLRAHMFNPSILILDEATSSLDSETEKKIQDALKILTKDRKKYIAESKKARRFGETRWLEDNIGFYEELYKYPHGHPKREKINSYFWNRIGSISPLKDLFEHDIFYVFVEKLLENLSTAKLLEEDQLELLDVSLL